MSQRFIYTLSRLGVGALLLFSGFAKGINPFGLSIQFGDYFSAMGLEALLPAAPLFSVLLPMAEMTLGVVLILGIYRRVAAWASLAVMSFFTLLTLWIALYNPVSDCGCFGDLFKISNWATFYKNLIFMAPTLHLFWYRRDGEERPWWRTVVLIAIACGFLPLHAYNNLPLIDATPFRVGTEVWAAMHDGIAEKSETRVRYKNIESGEVKLFELSDPTWQDEAEWEFVESVTEVIEEGKASTISQLPMINAEGVDKAQEVLTARGRTLLIVSVSPQHQSQYIAQSIAEAKAEGVDRIVLLHSTLGDVVIDGVEVYTTDLATLKTLVQSPHGGTIVLTNGKIIEKKRL